MKRLEGGYLGGRPTWSLASNPGIWGIEQVYARRVAGTWPAGGGSFDEYYEYVTFMLHADGANASTSFPDSSLYGRSLSVFGNAQVSTAQSKFGGASIAFDGNGDYLSVPSSTALDFQSGDYTIELWVRFNSVGSFQTILSRYQTWATVVQFYLELTTSSNIKYRAGNNVPVSVTSGTVVATNTWYHVAITCSSGTTRLFINGQLEASTGTAAVLSSGQPLGIGYELSGNAAYLNGYIDELRITKGYARYTSNFSVPTGPYEDEGAPLADPFYNYVSLLLPMNGSNNSTTFTDRSPNALTVTANGDAKLSTAVKRYGVSSALFDGTGDYLSTPNSALFDFGSGDFTIEAWVYTTTIAVGIRAIVGYANGSASNSNYAFQLLQTGSQWQFNIFSGTTSYGLAAGTAVANKWTHIALVRAGASLYSFVDGALANTSSVTGVTVNSPSGAVLHVGQVQGFYPWNGYIDDLRITKGVARYIDNFIPPLPHADYGTLADPYLAASTLWMPMEGPVNSTGFFDRADRLPVTTYGNAKISNAQYKWGLTSALFDGSGDFLSIPASTNFDLLGGDFTVEFWYKHNNPTDTTGSSVLCVGSASGYWQILIRNGAININNSPNGSTFNNFSASLALDTGWHHFAWTKSGSTQLVFHDGILLPASGTVPTAVATTALYVGANYNGGTTSFNGYIDDLRIIKGHARYTSNFTPPTAPINADTSSDPYLSNVSLLLKMDGANNSTAFTDSSLTPKTVLANGDAKISTAQSKFGGASALLDGTGDYLSLAHNAEFSIESSNFTLEAWIYVSASNVLQNILNKRVNTPTESGWGWRITAANALQFFHTGGSSLISTSTISSGTWTHVAVTRSGSTVRQFINGILDATTATFSNGVSNTQELRIGIDEGAAGGFNGYIDDLRVTKGVARYTANFIPPTISHPVWSETDASFSSVSLLLNGNGANASTVVADRSSNASTVVPNGNAQISTTQSRFGGSSLYFDGTGDYLSAGQVSAFEFGTGDFTVEVWTYLTGTTLSYPSILNFSHGSGSFALRYGDAGLGYKLQVTVVGYNGTWDLVYSANYTQTNANNAWKHIAFSRKDGQCYLFVDGVQQSLNSGVNPSTFPYTSFTAQVNLTSISNITIGSAWAGYIDDLRVTKGVARYTAAFTPPVAPHPIPVIDPYFGAVSLLLHMNGANASTTFPDHSYNALAVTANGNAQISTAQSKFGGASAAFDGTGDYLSVPSSTALDFQSGDYTIETWVRLNSIGGSAQTILNRYQTWTSALAFSLYLQSTGAIRYMAGNSAPVLLTSVSTITANAWHHIAVSCANGTTRLFVNGQLEASTSAVAAISSSAVLRLGANLESTPVEFLNGYIDELRITKGIARYTSTFTPPTTQFPNS